MSLSRTALLAAAAAAAQNCSRVVRVGTFDQATPYALAPSVHGLARRPGGRLEAGPAWLRARGSWHAGGAARAYGAAAVETVATPRGVVAAALTARAAPKHVDDKFQGVVAG